MSSTVTVTAVFVCRELLSSLAEEFGSGALCDWYQKPYDWFDGIVLQPPISDITGLFLIARYYAISSISTPRRWADGSTNSEHFIVIVDRNLVLIPKSSTLIRWAGLGLIRRRIMHEASTTTSGRYIYLFLKRLTLISILKRRNLMKRICRPRVRE